MKMGVQIDEEVHLGSYRRREAQTGRDTKRKVLWVFRLDGGSGRSGRSVRQDRGPRTGATARATGTGRQAVAVRRWTFLCLTRDVPGRERGQ